MRSILMISISMLFTAAASASTSGITYHGRILKPDGTALESTNVQFKLQIRTPDSSNCLLFEETKAMDMRNTSGVFELTINDGTGSRTDTTGLALDTLFANRGTLSGTSCAVTGIYTPSPNDGRRFVVMFRDENMTSWEPLPAQNLNFIPMAIEAKQVGGFSAATLLRVEDVSGPQPATALTPAQFTELFSLSSGTSTNYMKTSGNGALVPTRSGTPASPAAGQFWFDTASSQLKYYDGGSVQTLSSGGSLPALANGQFWIGNGSNVATAVTASGDATLSSGGAFTLKNTGTAGSYFKVTTDAQGRVTAGSAALVEADIPTLSTAGKVSGTAINSGTIGGTAAINTSGAITTTGNVTATNLSSTTTSAQSFRIFNAGNTQFTTLSVPAGLSSNFNFILPVNVGSSGNVLSTDGAGNLSWSPASAGSVTSITSTNNYVTVGGTAAIPTITANVGVVANTLAAGNDTRIVGALQRSGGTMTGALDMAGFDIASTGNLTISASKNLQLGTYAADPSTAGWGTAEKGRTWFNTASNQIKFWDGAAIQVIGTGSGTVASVSATAPLTVTGTATSPVVNLPAASGSQNGYLASADWTAFNGKLGTALANGSIWVGASGVATAVVPSGDATVSTTGVFSVGKILGTTVSATPTIAGQVLRYSGSQYTPGFVAMTDLRSTVTGVNAFPSSCLASQTLVYNSVGDSMSCSNISVTASQVSGLGTAAPLNVGLAANNVVQLGASAKLPAVDGSALTNLNASAITTGTLPVANGGTGTATGSITGTGALAFAAGGTNQNVTLTPSGTGATVLNGNVGVGTTSPTMKFEVSGGQSRFFSGSEYPVQILFDSPTASNRTHYLTQRSRAGGALLSGDTLGGLAMGGKYSGTQFTSGWDGGAEISAIATQNWSASSLGTALVFNTTTNFGALHESVRIDHNGNVGIGTTTPSTALHVVGDQLVSNKISIGSSSYADFNILNNGTIYQNGGDAFTRIQSTGGGNARVQLQSNGPSGGASDAGHESGRIDFGGSNGSTWVDQAAAVKGVVETTWTGVANPMALTFATTTGTTTTEKMRITGSGNVGIGTTSPAVSLDLSGRTDAVLLPNGTTAQQPASPANGMVRYNTSNNKLEAYENGSWANMINSSAGSLTAVSNISNSGGSISLNPSTGNSVLVNQTTVSTTPASGALVVYGGAGISGAVNVGGSVTSNSSITTQTTTVASSGSNSNSPSIFVNANYWNGSASAVDSFSIANILGTGANPTASLTFDHPTGTSGAKQYLFSNGNVGIGTNSPTKNLSFSGAAAQTIGMERATSGSGNNLTLNSGGALVGATDANGGDLVLSGGAATGNGGSNVIISTTQGYQGAGTTARNPSNKFIFTQDGKLGVGTVFPAGVIEAQGYGIGLRSSYPSNTVGQTQGMEVALTNAGGSWTVYGNLLAGITSNTNGAENGFVSLATRRAGTLTEAMRITSAGNVGIGITSPNRALDVGGSIRANGLLEAKNASSQELRFDGGSGNQWRAVSLINGATNGRLDFTNTTDNFSSVFTNVLSLSQNGNVGVGTTSPQAGLDVNTTGTASAVLVPRDTVANRPTGVNGMIRYASDTNVLEAFVNGGWSTLGTLGSNQTFSGNVSVGGTLTSTGAATLNGGATIAGGALAMSSQNITGVGNNITGSGSLTVAAGGTNQALLLKSSGVGNVNIGTANGTGLTILDGGASTVNYLTMKGSAAAGSPVLGTAGSDTNINLSITPKGTGSTNFTSGNVGIGTASPSAKLSVGGTAADNAYFFYDNANISSGTDGQSLYVYRRDSVGGDSSIRLYNDQYRQAHLKTAGNGNLFIEANQIYMNSPSPNGYLTSSSSAYYPDMGGPQVGSSSNTDTRAGGMILRTGNTAGNAQYAYVAALSNTAGYAPAIVIGAQTGATAYAERMRIEANGNVGIGTTSPSSLMHIENGVYAGAGQMRLRNTSSGGATEIAYYNDWGGNPLNIGVNGSGGFSAGPDGTFAYIRQTQAAPILFATSNIERMRLNSAGGLAIGTYDTANQFAVSPPIYSTGTASQSGTTVTGVGTSWTGALVGAQFSFYGGQLGGIITAVGSSTSLTVTNSQTVSAMKYAISAPGLTVSTAGLVGIGTTTPAVSLDIGSKTDAVRLPSGTTGQQPGSPANGMIRYNTTTNALEAYVSGSWQSLAAGTIPVANGGTGNTTQAFGSLTDGATITWAVSGLVNNASVTLGGNRTLSITGITPGSSGTFIVKQDATGSRTLTLPAGSKVVNGGGGAITLSTAANAIDIISFIYDGTNYYWTYGKNYN